MSGPAKRPVVRLTIFVEADNLTEAISSANRLVDQVLLAIREPLPADAARLDARDNMGRGIGQLTYECVPHGQGSPAFIAKRTGIDLVTGSAEAG